MSVYNIRNIIFHTVIVKILYVPVDFNSNINNNQIVMKKTSNDFLLLNKNIRVAYIRPTRTYTNS